MSVFDLLLLVAAAIVIVWFIRTVTRKDRDKERWEEDDNRTFFDEHGHWPDETPEQVAARQRRVAEAERLARRASRGG